MRNGHEDGLTCRTAWCVVATARHLSVHYRRTQRLLGEEVRCRYRVLMEEREQRSSLSLQMAGEPLHRLAIGYSGDQPVNRGLYLIDRVDQSTRADDRIVTTITNPHRTLQHCFGCLQPFLRRWCALVLQQPIDPPEQMSQARLSSRFREHPVRRQAIPNDRPFVVDSDQLSRFPRSPTTRDPVVRVLSRGRDVQPRLMSSDLPPRLIRREHRSVPHSVPDLPRERFHDLRQPQQRSIQRRGRYGHPEHRTKQPGHSAV